jgi:hypothetical protein
LELHHLYVPAVIISMSTPSLCTRDAVLSSRWCVERDGCMHARCRQKDGARRKRR